jgi:hypothetical protein
VVLFVDIEFARCRFSARSLANVFKAKIGDKWPLTFAITVGMEGGGWDLFIEELKAIPRLEVITELGWSENQISPELTPIFIE